jgi:large subunit ribosomal protein L35
MPKMKTRKAVKKRFKFTKTGKIKKSSPFKRHILTKKSRKRKRRLRKAGFVAKGERQSIRRLMPYG